MRNYVAVWTELNQFPRSNVSVLGKVSVPGLTATNFVQSFSDFLSVKNWKLTFSIIPVIFYLFIHDFRCEDWPCASRRTGALLSKQERDGQVFGTISIWKVGLSGLSWLIVWGCMNYYRTRKIITRSIQRMQTPPRLWPLTLWCDLDLSSRSRKLMSLDATCSIVSWSTVWCLWV